MLFEVLFPSGPPATAEALLSATAPWQRARPDRPIVLGNMVSAVDGHVTIDGGSTGLGGEGDKAMFHALRGVVDGVLAGTGTVRAEHYGRLVRSEERRAARQARGLQPDPVMLFVTRSGDVPWDAPLFGEPEQRVAIATGTPVDVPDGIVAQVTVHVLEDASAPAALRALAAAHDLRAVLCEGGPTLNAALLEGGVLDELFVTLSPQLVGGSVDAPRLVAPLADGRELRLAWVLRSGHELLLRYTV